MEQAVEEVNFKNPQEWMPVLMNEIKHEPEHEADANYFQSKYLCILVCHDRDERNLEYH